MTTAVYTNDLTVPSVKVPPHDTRTLYKRVYVKCRTGPKTPVQRCVDRIIDDLINGAIIGSVAGLRDLLGGKGRKSFGQLKRAAITGAKGAGYVGVGVNCARGLTGL